MYVTADICLQPESNQVCHIIHKIYQELRYLECRVWGTFIHHLDLNRNQIAPAAAWKLVPSLI